jgi:hypothetical protein
MAPAMHHISPEDFMSDASRHRSSMQGHRVDTIHAHPENRMRTLLPWLVLGLVALALLGWAVTRARSAERTGTNDSVSLKSDFDRGAGGQYERIEQELVSRPQNR